MNQDTQIRVKRETTKRLAKIEASVSDKKPTHDEMINIALDTVEKSMKLIDTFCGDDDSNQILADKLYRLYSRFER